MIDRRINYQYGGGADMGASSSRGPSAPPGGGATSLGSGRDFSISGAGDRIRDVAERQRRQELANLATQTFDQGDTSKDQFGFGATFRNEGIGGLARQYLTPSTILGGILGLINPFAGFAFRALKNIPNVRNIGEYKTLQDFYQNEIKPSPLGAQPVTAAGQADMMGTLNQFPSISGGITTVQPTINQPLFDVDLVRRLIEQKQAEE